MDSDKLHYAHVSLHVGRETTNAKNEEFLQRLTSYGLTDEAVQAIVNAYLEVANTYGRLLTAELYHEYVQEPSRFVKMAEKILASNPPLGAQGNAPIAQPQDVG
jgi:hypothetical protein